MSDTKPETPAKKPGNKVSKATAEAQINSLLEHYDLEPDDIAIEQGPEAMQTIMNGLVKAVQHGRLEIDLTSGFSVVQTLQRVPDGGEVNTITWKEVSGWSTLALDKKKTENAKRFAFISALTDIPEAGLKKIKGSDFGTMRRLCDLFSVV